MIDLSYVVVSTPRSGTLYIRDVLDGIGLQCTHEESLNPIHGRVGLGGDSSWYLVASLSCVRSGALILHQIRDPLDTINSIARLIHIWRPEGEESSEWRERMARQPSPSRGYAFSKNFIFDHALKWGWPKWPDDWAGKVMHFWYHWHRQIEKHIGSRRSFRYRLEDLDVVLLSDINGLIGGDASEVRMQSVLSSVSKRRNAREGRSGRYVIPCAPTYEACDLSSEVMDLAGKYGYAYN